MGKKKSAKQVPIPDINALATRQFAEQQVQADKALNANRANQNNQYGSLKWDRDPTTGAWTQTEAYNPEQQGLLDQQVKNQGQMGDMVGDVLNSADMNYSGAPTMPTVGGYNQQAIDTIRALQAPQLERRRNASQARMAAMGLGTGSGMAWDTEQQNLGTSENQADMEAIMAGIGQGNTEFGQGLQARNAYTGEQDRMLQSAGGLMSGAVPTDMQFGDYAKQGVVDAPDYAGNALKMWEAQQAQANAKAAAQKGGMLGGIGTLAGAGIGAFYGGPAGAKLGASIGGSAGSLFDK